MTYLLTRELSVIGNLFYIKIFTILSPLF